MTTFALLRYDGCVSKSTGLERQKDLHLRRREAAWLFDGGFSQAEVARRLLFSGAIIDAVEAQRIGLLDQELGACC